MEASSIKIPLKNLAIYSQTFLKWKIGVIGTINFHHQNYRSANSNYSSQPTAYGGV